MIKKPAQFEWNSYLFSVILKLPFSENMLFLTKKIQQPLFLFPCFIFLSKLMIISYILVFSLDYGPFLMSWSDLYWVDDQQLGAEHTRNPLGVWKLSDRWRRLLVGCVYDSYIIFRNCHWQTLKVIVSLPCLSLHRNVSNYWFTKVYLL